MFPIIFHSERQEQLVEEAIEWEKRSLEVEAEPYVEEEEIDDSDDDEDINIVSMLKLHKSKNPHGMTKARWNAMSESEKDKNYCRMCRSFDVKCVQDRISKLWVVNCNSCSNRDTLTNQ